jgi:hypothetical protein
MLLIRRLSLLALAVLALICASISTGPSVALADDKELALRGLVDCGKKVETACDIKDAFFFWTSDITGVTSSVKVDITWIKPERIPAIDQEDELCLTGSMREDQVYQAWSINENCDEGTVNDKDEIRDKKQESKDKNRN